MKLNPYMQFVNFARAKSSFRMVKTWANIWGGAVLMVILTGIFSIFVPSVGNLPQALTAIFAIIGFLGTATSIAVLAQDLGRNYFAWLFGSLMFGPISLVVSYFRVRFLAMEHGIE
jgi:heme A synthase